MRLVLLALLLLGCGARPTGRNDDAGIPATIANRPYGSQVPAGSDFQTGRAAPLVILLHGYGASGAAQDLYWGFGRYAAERGVLYAYPDGTRDGSGNRFWNATDVCCNFAGLPVDDVAYVDAVIEDMSRRYAVDRKRVYVIGHSNGGFMSHRLACDLSSKVAAIVSLAGSNWQDPARCQPSEPVAVLQVHGDADSLVPYQGGGALPSARASVAGWAERDGCAATATSAGVVDVDTQLSGAETTVERWEGCRAGGAAELWTIRGGGHVPALGGSWPALIYGFLAAHPKP